ncbi:MAG: phosphomannomutase/phosphoglucomutase [Candidatus Aenigmatarchaeota archaeon]
MEIDRTIFRAYDIRGVYGQNLTEEVAEKIGMAAGKHATGTFTVGRDFRSHGKALEDAFVSGLLKVGCDVNLVGVGPTILPVFANWIMKNDVAACITGSHLTAEWNGIKLFRQDGVGFFEHENKRLGELAASELEAAVERGVVKELDNVEEQYIKFVKENVKPEKVKVVIDFGNGAACLLVPKIIDALGNVEAVYLFDTPDATFPNRNPEPDDESLSELKRRVVAEKADLGIAFDGDGDRVVFVDDEGKFLMPEESSVLFIRDIMKSRKGCVVANIECSSIIEEEVGKFGQKVVRIPVGHTFLVQETKRNDAVFGIEKSGHLTIPKFYWFDDAILNGMYMIELVSKLGSKVSELRKGIPKRFFKRFKADCPDDMKGNIMDRLKEKFAAKYENVNTMDGVRVDFADGWILMRVSNTSPMIRLSIEAKDEKRLQQLYEEFFSALDEEVKRVA